MTSTPDIHQPPNPQTEAHYYQEFAGATFVTVVQELSTADDGPLPGILKQQGEFLRHGIRNVLVYGSAPAANSEQRSAFDRCMALQRQVVERCHALGIPCAPLDPGVVRCERLLKQPEMGRVKSVDIATLSAAATAKEAALPLVIVPNGSRDEGGHYLEVDPYEAGAEVAAGLKAEKLLLLSGNLGIMLPTSHNGDQLLSFVDVHGLEELLLRRDKKGQPLIQNPTVLKLIWAAHNAVLQGVSSVHIIKADGEALHDEALTHLGSGTWVERFQSLKINGAHEQDLHSLLRIREQCMQPPHQTEQGTPFLKRQDDEAAYLRKLLPTSLVLRHRAEPIGTIYFDVLPKHPGTALIGGFAVAEKHQNTQHGQSILQACMAAAREAGFDRAVSITASPAVQALYTRLGGKRDEAGEFAAMLEKSQSRFHDDEKDQVQLFVFDLKAAEQSE